MEDILDGLREALDLLLGGNPSVWQIILLSLQVSGLALLCSTLVGIPIGTLLGLTTFCGRKIIITLIYTGMGFPPVVIGLLVYLLLSRAGPLGFLGWLFTPSAMILAQTIISLPLIAGFTMAAVASVDPALRLQIRSLGATPWQMARATLWEARNGVVVAIIAGFGRIIAEVGAVMLVGGNIDGSTRVLTTAIVLETRRGAFDLALALSFVLIGIALLINAITLYLQGRISA
ncbi:MAG: tungstate transporter permease [Chloroflexi bacterium AL-W]|nr:tungstate transporter permease [Chloroflexi bacterium AL-N1]NOK69554.1 tungstate transporter permease [Chloroflexi bacterium AL-N10]NOK77519.1 tungstate transporter permease [Chloroflexi bacterium AL-N5]NOK84370.1 tungstate transporter permease [Chloroflexi bacterium AL-W]NOK91464.1 tungstate transporter permease [Chloroflexi bacterium AL-N15]